MNALADPIHVAVPGALAQVTGGYIYDARIVAGLGRRGVRVTVHELSGDHPGTDEPARTAAATAIADAPAGEIFVIDGLALPAFLPVLEAESARRPIVALVHHPLADETGIAPARAAELRQQETAALAFTRRVIVTSPATATAVQAMGVPADRIGIVLPGVNAPPTPPAAPSAPPGQALRLLCVATLTPRKGHLLLIEALAGLRHLPWHLDCVGSADRDPATTTALQAAIQANDLTDRVTLHGERPPAAIAGAYEAADLFVLPSWHEGYGMAFAEALSHGLPVVGTTAGAIPGTVPADAGILVPPGDTAALRDALERLLTDGAFRQSLAAGARRARFPTWDEAAALFADELERALS